MRYDLIYLNADGNKDKIGYIDLDRKQGDWSFSTNDTNVAEFLREVGNRKYVEKRDSETTEDGSIVELATPISPKDREFIDALSDGLIQYSILRLKPKNE